VNEASVVLECSYASLRPNSRGVSPRSKLLFSQANRAGWAACFCYLRQSIYLFSLWAAAGARAGPVGRSGRAFSLRWSAAHASVRCARIRSALRPLAPSCDDMLMWKCTALSILASVFAASSWLFLVHCGDATALGPPFYCVCFVMKTVPGSGLSKDYSVPSKFQWQCSRSWRGIFHLLSPNQSKEATERSP